MTNDERDLFRFIDELVLLRETDAPETAFEAWRQRVRERFPYAKLNHLMVSIREIADARIRGGIASGQRRRPA